MCEMEEHPREREAVRERRNNGSQRGEGEKWKRGKWGRRMKRKQNIKTAGKNKCMAQRNRFYENN